jgi:hypothetical protein
MSFNFYFSLPRQWRSGLTPRIRGAASGTEGMMRD